jgi:hypothetical protein
MRCEQTGNIRPDSCSSEEVFHISLQTRKCYCVFKLTLCTCQSKWFDVSNVVSYLENEASCTRYKRNMLATRNIVWNALHSEPGWLRIFFGGRGMMYKSRLFEGVGLFWSGVLCSEEFR